MLYIAAAAVLAFFAARALKRARSGTAQENARGGEPPVAKDTADAPAKSIPVADNWPSRPPVIRSVSSLQPASLAKSTMRWVGNGECFAIGGYSLQDPMVYCADKYSRDIDASCIVASLPVTSPVLEPKGALGYWPEYTHLSPGQRANYLAWLAGGRRGPLADIGYVFIYFYGLERRVLVDGKDAWAAVEEVLGLLRTYRDSRSLDGYLSSFVAFIIALSGLQHLDEKAFKRLLMTGLPAHTDNTLRLCLAWHCAHAKGLPADLAYEVARCDARCARSVVLKRLPQEHRTLFIQRYSDRFGQGMKLSESKRMATISHFPASPSLLRNCGAPVRTSATIVDVLAKSAQFKPLVDLWNDCIDELRAASSHVAKGAAITDRAAYETLPAELRGLQDHPDKAAWDALVTEHMRESGYAKVPVGSLASARGIGTATKLSKKDSVELAQAAGMLGYGIVPDPWSLQRGYAWDEQVILLAEGDLVSAEGNATFRAAALLLELGMAMAAADGEVNREEVVHLSELIRGQFTLSREYARRLEAYRGMLIKDPPSLTGLGKRVERALEPAQRVAVARYLAAIVALDGHLHPKEVAAFKTVCRAMKLASAEMENILAEMNGTQSPNAEPVPVLQQIAGPPGESIPPMPDQPPSGIVLDMSLISRITSETAEVARMLGEAMGELHEAAMSTDSHGANAASSIEQTRQAHTASPWVIPHEGLGERYRDALHALLDRVEWSKDELRAVAEKHGLMPNALIDEVNNWAEACLGDYLIEGENPYQIQHSLLERAA